MISSGANHREIFSVDSEMLGERQIRAEPRGKHPSYSHLVWSRVFVCPRCGDAWGRRSYIPAGGYTTRWTTEHRLCERCGDGRLLTVGGLEPDIFHPEQFPLTVLRRELAMYANLISKGEL